MSSGNLFKGVSKLYFEKGPRSICVFLSRKQTISNKGKTCKGCKFLGKSLPLFRNLVLKLCMFKNRGKN